MSGVVLLSSVRKAMCLMRILVWNQWEVCELIAGEIVWNLQKSARLLKTGQIDEIG